MHGDRQPDGVGEVVMDTFEDPIEQLVLGILARMELGGRAWCATHSSVMTVATRSKPEMPSRALIGPSAATIIVSSVVAATANRARTAALSQ